MIFNIILIVLFALQTVILLTFTIIRNREIDKEVKKSDDLLKGFDFAKPYRLMWGEWYQNQFGKQEEEK